MDELEKDFENCIPVIKVQVNSSSELKVITDGINGERRTERLNLVEEEKEEERRAPTFGKRRDVTNVFSLSIEDISHVTQVEDCWKIYNRFFYQTLIYGKVVVLNQFTKNEKEYFRLSIDDGTGEVAGTYSISRDNRVASK